MRASVPMRPSPPCRGDFRSGCGRSGGGGGGVCDDGGGGGGGSDGDGDGDGGGGGGGDGDGKREGVEVLATTVTGRWWWRGRRFVVVVVVVVGSGGSDGGDGGGSDGGDSNSNSNSSSGGGSSVFGGRRRESPCRFVALELARVRASCARTPLSFEACARARERVCPCYPPARASKEFTIEQHGGTPSKCLNGRIVHYHPSVAG